MLPELHFQNIDEFLTYQENLRRRIAYELYNESLTFESIETRAYRLLVDEFTKLNLLGTHVDVWAYCMAAAAKAAMQSHAATHAASASIAGRGAAVADDYRRHMLQFLDSFLFRGGREGVFGMVARTHCQSKGCAGYATLEDKCQHYDELNHICYSPYCESCYDTLYSLCDFDPDAVTISVPHINYILAEMADSAAAAAAAASDDDEYDDVYSDDSSSSSCV